MRAILMILLSVFMLNAKVTNEDIMNKLNDLDKKYELLKKEMEIKFDAIDKRFEMMNDNFNKRFDAVDKRFEMMNDNFNKRFEAIDKRFEDMNRRFEFIENLMIALVAGIFGLIGFMMWDRRTVVEKAKSEIRIECEKKERYIQEIDMKKVDKDYMEKIIKAINEVLAKDSEAAKIFHKYGII